MVKKNFMTKLRSGLLIPLFSLVVLLTTIAVIAVFTISRANAKENANRLFSQASALARTELDRQLGSLLDLTSFGAVIPDLDHDATGKGLIQDMLPFMRRAFERNTAIYSLYCGLSDGSFIQVIRSKMLPATLQLAKAPADSALIVRSLGPMGVGRPQYWTFLSADGRVIGERQEKNANFDPRNESWYLDGMTRSSAILSGVEHYNQLNSGGISATQVLPGKRGVFGADMSLDHLGEFTEQHRPSFNGGIAILNTDGSVMVSSRSLQPLILQGKLRVPPSWLLSSGHWKNGEQRINFVLAAPFSDFTAAFQSLQQLLLVLSLVMLLLVLPAGIYQMKRSLTQGNEALDTALTKLNEIVKLGIAMSAEKDINRLVDMILHGAKQLSHADGGSLYLKGKDESLDFQIVLNDSLGFQQGGTSADSVRLAPVPLYNPDGSANHHNVVTHAFLTGQTINIEDAYAASEFDFSGTRSFDLQNGYHSQSFLTIPLQPRGGEVMGALQLINARDPDSLLSGAPVITAFSPEIQRFVEALAAQAATALYNRDLLETQKQLFDAMIQFIAGAIDAKSHYTGAHCARVPKLALMLAQKVSQVQEGPLAGFSFNNEDQWHEFKVGAWLHDCGKVTTPEYVVDKATKLETIHNRIHEIRTRFEVLLRDAKIEALEAQLAGQAPTETEDRLFTVIKSLQEDFAFIASCNSGDEMMTTDRLERLAAIAEKSWMSHFDDRLGLSWEELKRIEHQPVLVLPHKENLLSDKVSHLIPRKEDFYLRYEGYGFNLPVPEYLYNHGELHNLSIIRGTLNTEERFKINEHIMQTIVMLEALPLPRTLTKVPDYAGTHHETLSGNGYPRGLNASQLSVPARIMAIADIFEALTAADRPYKRAKSLSECVKILHNFKQEGHIDGDIFDLFLTSGVYRSYAEIHLRPDQLDEVDISPYLG